MKSTKEFTARCECGDICISNRRIANYWTRQKCNKCEKKLCVFQNDNLIYDYNNISFTATCQCGMFCFRNKVIPTYWSQMKCQKCEHKLTVRDPDNNILYNFQSKFQTIRPKQLSIFIEEKKEVSPIIKNDVFMGFSPFEQFPSHSLTIQDIDNALDFILQDISSPYIEVITSN